MDLATCHKDKGSLKQSGSRGSAIMIWLVFLPNLNSPVHSWPMDNSRSSKVLTIYAATGAYLPVLSDDFHGAAGNTRRCFSNSQRLAPIGERLFFSGDPQQACRLSGALRRLCWRLPAASGAALATERQNPAC